MDPKYLLGIPEIDAQHEGISELVKSLQEVISDKHKRHLIHPVLKQLNHLLVDHFAYEESLMKMVNVTDLTHHKKKHKDVLNLFQTYFAHPPAPGDYEYLGQLISKKVLGHVMEQDIPMSESVRGHLGRYAAPRRDPPEGGAACARRPRAGIDATELAADG
jgi:hemerythrin-like metal-binding protein